MSSRRNHVTTFLRLALLGNILIGTALNIGCVPKEVAVLSSSSGGGTTYAGFSGAVSAQTMSATKVKVSWNQSSDANVVAYNIYDATFKFSPRLIKTVAAPASSITLTGLASSTYYAFRVRAASSTNVEDSNTSDVPAIPYGGVSDAQILDSTSASIPWEDSSNADAVSVYCKSTASPDYVLVSRTTTVTSTSAKVSNLIGGVEYTCRAALTINGYEDNNTTTTVFTPMGTATKLVFTSQPGSGLAGSALGVQPVIKIVDANGTLVSAGPDAEATVSLTISNTSPTAGSIRGTASVTAVGGIATFTGLSLNEAGTKVMTATKSDTSGKAMGSTTLTEDSNQFTISPGSVSPDNCTIAVTPSGPLVADGNTPYTVTIFLADQYGNAISGTKPQFASSVAGDTLTQPTSNTTSSGIATASIATTIADSTRIVYISSPTGLSTVTTAAPFIAGAATKLAFTTQPSNAGAGVIMGTMKVAVQDAYGNTVNTGVSASASVSLAIASNTNGATISGTIPTTAVNGVATYSDISIDKTGTSYKILATSGALTPAYSNSFNITAASPAKISVSSATSSVYSGSCSGSISLQLRDSGNNASNAIQSTPVTISGLGNGALYTSSSCTGTPQSSTVTFTSGTNTKTFYFKDLKAESITITATDPSAVLTTGTFTLNSIPDKISLSLASATVVAGVCSQALTITPMGDNGNAGPLFSPTTVALTGVSGTSAVVYSDAACTMPLVASAIVLPAATGNIYTTNVYIKDNKSETLSLNVAEINAVMTTTSIVQSLSVLASNISFTGPSSVVAGACSTAFTIVLTDALSNAVIAPANTTLTISGLAGTTTGKFYINSSCTGAGSSTSVTVPAGNSTISVYFKDTVAEALTVHLMDTTGQLADSNTISIGISPSAFGISSSATTAQSSTCAGPFYIQTLDGAGNVTNAISAITATLSGEGTAGTFYSDSACSSTVTSFLFAAGENKKTFYFRGLYPESLTLTATDSAAILTAGTYALTITAGMSFIGTASTTTDSNNNLLWFTQGVMPVSARYDGTQSAYAIHLDSTKSYLYVVDTTARRILKYDYINKTYIGWIGEYSYTTGSGIAINGSNLTTPSPASCIATTSGSQTPGWCTGGSSVGNGNNALGKFNYPLAITDDGDYIYVADRNGFVVTRYDATTGAFAGWIGRVYTTPTASGAGAPATCTSTSPNSVTPGWCMGGQNHYNGTMGSNPGLGDGTIYYPRTITYSGGYLYVGQQGAVLRFNASTGTFAGWIGYVGSTLPTSCISGTAATGAITPSWCTGGSFTAANPKTFGGAVNDPTGMYTDGTTLYIVHADNSGTITKYNLSTGSYLGYLSNLTFNWTSPYSITGDGTYLYVADYNRLLRIDTTGTIQGWLGKVSAQPTGGDTGCSTTPANGNTPGWCLGGSAKYGLEEQAFHQLTAVEYDGNGNLLTGQSVNFPGVKKWSTATGAYVGTLANQSTSPVNWSSDATALAHYQGFDENSMYQPTGMYADSSHLYVVELASAVIKKYLLKTGALIGKIGGITTSPTGGASGCIGFSPFGGSPNWCLGSLFQPNYMWGNMMSTSTNGIMYQPMAMTSDGTNIYVVDYGLHRIQKFLQADGTYIGWIGKVSSVPTGGATGCTSTTAGNFTPGWCTGGTSTSGNDDGAMNSPTSIVYSGGTLYVLDYGNKRVSSYNALTGSFNGWIGRINTTPTGGCTTTTNANGYTISGTGWCKGGTAQSAPTDKGGGFDFTSRSAITTDGSYLYITNGYNYRIDKFSLAGTFVAAASSRWDNYTYTWTTNTTTLGSTWANLGCDYPRGLWTDGTYLYGTGYNQCYNIATSVAWKMNLSTGTMIGWKGRVYTSPSAGDTGCAGAPIGTITPGWCQGGVANYGYTLGGFTGGANFITGDSNFIYVSDEGNHRVTRLPK